MKILIAAVLLLLVMPVMAVPTVQEYLYNYAMQDPNIGQCMVVVDAAHIGVTITPGTYSKNMQAAVAKVMVGYYGVLLQVPEYNGYLRVGVAVAGKIVAIWEIEAIDIRSAHETGGSDQVAKVINDHAYGEGTSIRYYVSDGYGDVTKSVSDGPYGRLSASEGNWL
jgi:hypothetical protein